MPATKTRISGEELEGLKELKARLQSFHDEYQQFRPLLQRLVDRGDDSALATLQEIECVDGGTPFLSAGLMKLDAYIAVRGDVVAHDWWFYRVDGLFDAGYYRREVTGDADADDFERFDAAFAGRYPDLWLALNRASDKHELAEDVRAAIMGALAEMTA